MPEPSDLFSGAIDKRSTFPMFRSRRRFPTRFIVTHYTNTTTLEDAVRVLLSRRPSPLSYHFIIDTNGTVYQYVGTNNYAGHGYEANSYSVAVSMVGLDESVVRNNTTQVQAGVRLVQSLQDAYGLARSQVYGHGEVAQGNVPEKTKMMDEGATVRDLVRGGQLPVPYSSIKEELARESGEYGGFINQGGGRRASHDRPVYSRMPTGAKPKTPGITPFIGSRDSFHPNIQYELTRRRMAKNTAITYMPFVKLTSLMRVQEKHITGGTSELLKGYCPSIGPHGYEQQLGFEEIYYPQTNASTVGYVTEDLGNERYPRVPLVVSAEDARLTDAANIPMPGIVDMSLDRSTAGPMGVRGGLMKADIKIFAHSVGQLNVLLTYFLRPSTRVVLEMGRMSSDPSEQIVPYDWTIDQHTIKDDFTALIFNPEAQQEFIENTVYKNNGNYEIFIGYVVKFDLKYTKENVYEITLVIHSVQQFEIPTAQTGVKSLCANPTSKCIAMDIREYFDEAHSYKENSFRRLMETEQKISLEQKNKTKQTNWNDHFVAIKNSTTGDFVGGSKQAGMDENEYFVSWRFFVEKILQDTTYGIASVIPRATDPTDPAMAIAQKIGSLDIDLINSSAQTLLRLGLLRPIEPIEFTDKTNKDEVRAEMQESLLANEVGYHPDLRSTDPNVMIIYNEIAQRRLTQDEVENFVQLRSAAQNSSDVQTRTGMNDNSHVLAFIKKSEIGSFGAKETTGEVNKPASAFLTNGVWLNTKAIKQAFAQADTVSQAINELLKRMNTATQGYWNLQLYSADRTHSGLFVIDMGLSKRLPNKVANSKWPYIDKEEVNETSLLRSVDEITPIRYQKSPDQPTKSKYLYMFNRGTKRLEDSEHLGSELIDLNVEFSLPQVIAVQAIAGIGGSAQKSALNSININQLKQLAIIPELYVGCGQDDICKNDDCKVDNIQPLKKIFDEAQKTVSELPNPETITDVVEKERAAARLESAKEFLETSRNNYYAADIQQRYGNVMVISKARELSHLGTLLEYIEFNSAGMMKKLNRDSTNAEDGRMVPMAHAFNSSNLTKTVVSVTLPGIGGIELFQSFVVDRVPSILERGYYVVTKVSHKFTSKEGWITTIEGRFVYRPAAEDIGPGNAKPDPNCQPNPEARRTPTVGGARTTRRTAPPVAAQSGIIEDRNKALMDLNKKLYQPPLSDQELVALYNEKLEAYTQAKIIADKFPLSKGVQDVYTVTPDPNNPNKFGTVGQTLKVDPVAEAAWPRLKTAEALLTAVDQAMYTRTLQRGQLPAGGATAESSRLYTNWTNATRQWRQGSWTKWPPGRYAAIKLPIPAK